MKWQVQVLQPEFEKQKKKKGLSSIPPRAWDNGGIVVARSYVRADEKARRNHPNRTVHTFITE